jgi:hypothetical protein
MNYRSVVIFGRARPVETDGEKTEALRAFTEHVMPGRWREARPPSRQELDATLVLAVPLEEASAKVRTGPPLDDEEDKELAVWAGVVPLRLTTGEAIPDPQLPEGVDVPAYLKHFRVQARQRGEDQMRDK